MLTLIQTYIRWPGGNMLEGLTLGTEWDWKDTLGPLRNRPGFQGVWGYQQTHGLGIVEYLEWSIDMELEMGEWARKQSGRSDDQC